MFSADGERIVTGSEDRTARVWDARTGSCVLELNGHMGRLLSVVFSPDDTRIGTGSDDGTARVWDARSGTSLLQLKGHSDSVNSVSFSPDGMRIVTGSDDQTLRVWDGLTGLCLLEVKVRMHSVDSVSFSPDGNRIVAGSNSTRFITHDHFPRAFGIKLLDARPSVAAGRTERTYGNGAVQRFSARTGADRHRKRGRHGEGVGRTDRNVPARDQGAPRPVR